MIDLIELARTVKGPGPDVTRTLASTPRTVPSNVRMAGIGAIVLGLASAAYGLSSETHRTLGVILTCLVYFTGLSLGGLMFATVQTITLGRWGRPFKRISESFATFLPFAWVLWALFLLGGGIEIYPWLTEQMPAHKATYLQPGFMRARVLIGLGFLVVLAMMFLRNSLRADIGAAAESVGARAPSWWSGLTAGWQGRAAETEATYQKNIRLAPIIVVSYMLLFSMIVVDTVMSLDPHWYANMFPAWLCVSSMWLALQWTTIISVYGRKWLQIDHLITPKNYHDLGKLMFALTVFWTYNLFAQILPIWYGNMPEETGFLMLRMFVEPWTGLSMAVGALCFLFPFTVLLSRGIKKLPESLAPVAMIMAVGVFLERFLLVMPQVWTRDTLPLGMVEIGVFVGFVGAFVTVVTSFLAQVPPVAFTDPFINENPSDVHVHPIGGHDHAHGH